MVFPIAEAKFSRLVRSDTPPRTAFLVRLYQVTDGGLDVDGQQQYSRALKRTKTIDVPLVLTKAQVLARARQELDQLIADNGWTLTEAQIRVTL
jgi:hypothetical protein